MNYIVAVGISIASLGPCRCTSYYTFLGSRKVYTNTEEVSDSYSNSMCFLGNGIKTIDRVLNFFDEQV